MPFSATVIYVHLNRIVHCCTSFHVITANRYRMKVLLTNYELCTMFTFFRVKKLSDFISTVSIVLTRSAYLVTTSSYVCL